MLRTALTAFATDGERDIPGLIRGSASRRTTPIEVTKKSSCGRADRSMPAASLPEPASAILRRRDCDGPEKEGRRGERFGTQAESYARCAKKGTANYRSAESRSVVSLVARSRRPRGRIAIRSAVMAAIDFPNTLRQLAATLAIVRPRSAGCARNSAAIRSATRPATVKISGQGDLMTWGVDCPGRVQWKTGGATTGRLRSAVFQRCRGARSAIAVPLQRLDEKMIQGPLADALPTWTMADGGA